jgi:hypothetical protein
MNRYKTFLSSATLTFVLLLAMPAMMTTSALTPGPYSGVVAVSVNCNIPTGPLSFCAIESEYIAPYLSIQDFSHIGSNLGIFSAAGALATVPLLITTAHSSFEGLTETANYVVGPTPFTSYLQVTVNGFAIVHTIFGTLGPFSAQYVLKCENLNGVLQPWDQYQTLTDAVGSTESGTLTVSAVAVVSCVT